MCAEGLFQDEQFIKVLITFVVFFPARIQMESVFPTETTAQFLYSI